MIRQLVARLTNPVAVPPVTANAAAAAVLTADPLDLILHMEQVWSAARPADRDAAGWSCSHQASCPGQPVQRRGAGAGPALNASRGTISATAMCWRTRGLSRSFVAWCVRTDPANHWGCPGGDTAMARRHRSPPVFCGLPVLGLALDEQCAPGVGGGSAQRLLAIVRSRPGVWRRRQPAARLRQGRRFEQQLRPAVRRTAL